MARNPRSDEAGEVGDDGLTPEEREAARQAAIAALDARREAYVPDTKAPFPQWAWALIGLGVVVAAGVAFYFLRR